MTLADEVLYMTADEYLAVEAKAAARHEFVNGCVFAMSGATRRHNLLSGNIFSILHSFLKGSACRPYIETVKVRVVSANCFYYPDVMVACDSFEGDSVYTEEPVLVVEVLSPSTAAIDRREKLVNYQQIPSLMEYLIVHQKRKCVDLFRRNKEQGVWECYQFLEGDELTLRSIPHGELIITVEAIYENVGSLKNPGTGIVREGTDFDYVFLTEQHLADFDW